jgi:hypothetical protein
MGVCGERHAPPALRPGKRIGIHFTSGLVGPRVYQDLCGNFSPLRLDLRTVKHLANRYTDWANATHLRKVIAYSFTSSLLQLWEIYEAQHSIFCSVTIWMSLEYISNITECQQKHTVNSRLPLWIMNLRLIAHDSAICRNTKICNFTRGEKYLHKFSSMLFFYENIRKINFLWIKNFRRESV